MTGAGDLRVAIHEAAHAIVGAALGFRVESVTVVETDDYSGRASFAEMDVDLGYAPSSERWLRAHLYTIIAGVVSEASSAGAVSAK